MEGQQQHGAGAGEGEGSTLQLEVLRHTLSARESEINQLREFATLEKQAHTDFLEEAKVGSRLSNGKENDIELAILKRELAAARAEAEKYKTGMVLMKQMATEEYLLGKIQKRFESEAARIVAIVDSSSI